MKFDHQKIEKKWQELWEEKKVFVAEDNSTKEKYYILDMFPYPSGAGLHVGHVVGYTGTDVVSRYKRMLGFNVLHPMGWDSFGLPAEQYAVKTGCHPQKTTEKNISTYKKQLVSLGFSYDWSREVRTSDPTYYKWTQWLFTKLYEKGLAYQAEVHVNFCPKLGTVLANEEVEDGVAKEGGYPVIRKPLKQWMLKITEYADRLLEDLEDLNWPESIKKLQKNWIGKSEGARVIFKESETQAKIECFTTRPDTLYGVSFIAIAPESSLIEKIVTKENQDEVAAYKKATLSKSDLERTELNKDKTGVFTGAYATCPLTKRQIPIWVSDFVLGSYGTGAVMGVPGHDERDFAFASKFNLPITCVIAPPESDPDRDCALEGKCCYSGEGKAINSGSFDGLATAQVKTKVIEALEASNSGKKEICYKLRDWLFSRQRYWGEPFPLLYFEDGSVRTLKKDELPLTPPEVSDYKPSEEGLSPLAKEKKWVEITDTQTGKKAYRETNTMPQWAGSCWYYLRFIDPDNTSEAWDAKREEYWMPVDLYVGGVEHAVLHLLYARFWHKVFYDIGLVSTKEPFAQLRNQGLVTSLAYKKPGGGYVAPDQVEKRDSDFYEKGTDNRVSQIMEKMSKSKLNGVLPGDIIDEYGADALRLYELFMGPFEKEKVWNSQAVSGCHRFLNRFYQLFTSEKICDQSNQEAESLTHKLVIEITNDIENMSFNTSVAHFMEFMNAFVNLPIYPKSCLSMLVRLLSPFAPHISEECWSLLGEKGFVSLAPFPKGDSSKILQSQMTIVVQTNGKKRGEMQFPEGTDKETILDAIRTGEKYNKYFTTPPKKVIYVPGKLVNIVL